MQEHKARGVRAAFVTGYHRLSALHRGGHHFSRR